MITTKSYIAAPKHDQHWRFEVPRQKSAKMQLLTIGGTSVVGHWYGALGFAFVAWAPLLKVEEPAQPADRLTEAVELVKDLVFSNWDPDFISYKYNSEDADENSLRERVRKVLNDFDPEH